VQDEALLLEVLAHCVPFLSRVLSLCPSVSFASLLLLLSLACLFFIWSIIGQVWTFSAKTNICGGQLYDTSLWLIIVSYVVAVLQSCLSCCRCACALTKDMLPL
jgi:hypothetical protein